MPGASTFQLPNNRLQFAENGHTGEIALIAGTLQQSLDGGAFSALCGGWFGANTTVQLPNNLSVNVNALNVQTSLTNNTSGSEASQWVIRLLKGGVGAPGGGFGVDTITLAPDQITLNSTTATLSLFSDVKIYRDVGGGSMNFDSNGGDTIISSSSVALATNTTLGFLQITQCAGAPTGVPGRQKAFHTPMIYDTTNNKIWFYNGSWRGVVVA